MNNTSFPFPQQLSQLPQSTQREAGGWGGESNREIREPLTSLGRSMGCFTRKMDQVNPSLKLIAPTYKEKGGLLILVALVGYWFCHLWQILIVDSSLAIWLWPDLVDLKMHYCSATIVLIANDPVHISSP